MVSAVESLEFQVELSFRGVVAPLRSSSFSSVGVRIDESSSDGERRMGRLSSSPLVREEEERERLCESIAAGSSGTYAELGTSRRFHYLHRLMIGHWTVVDCKTDGD
jgi:hypothetical protein